MKGHIILLNGVSSSGKSTLARELVKSLPQYFHFSLDDFDMVIEQMEDRGGDRLIPVPTEHFFHRNIAMFSDAGVNLIVDHVLHNQDVLQDFQTSLTNYPVLWVGVHCSTEELTRREQARGDRRIGLAQEQSTIVHHQDENYHVEIDTSIESTESCVKTITKAVMKNS